MSLPFALSLLLNAALMAIVWWQAAVIDDMHAHALEALRALEEAEKKMS